MTTRVPSAWSSPRPPRPAARAASGSQASATSHWARTPRPGVATWFAGRIPRPGAITHACRNDTIKRYEAGQAQPTLDVVRALAVALGVSADELVFGKHTRGPDEELRLQFEAIQKLDREDKKVIKAVLEALILKGEAKRWAAATLLAFCCASDLPPPLAASDDEDALASSLDRAGPVTSATRGACSAGEFPCWG